MGLEFLNRMDAEQAGQQAASLRAGKQATSLQAGQPTAGIDNPFVQASPEQALRIHYPLPSLENLLQSLSPLEPQILLIGGCDDDIPILLDLTNPAAGSLLLLGDRLSGKTRLLGSMVQSACSTTPRRELRIAGISSSQLEWQHAASSAHTYKWTSTRGIEASAIIHELARVCEQRRFGRENGPTLLLVIDELSELLENLDAQTVELLTWLARSGPAQRTWVLAALDSGCQSSAAKVIGAFGTKLFGSIASIKPAAGLEPIPQEVASGLVAGAQFCLKIDGNWLPFWIPSRE